MGKRKSSTDSVYKPRCNALSNCLTTFSSPPPLSSSSLARKYFDLDFIRYYFIADEILSAQFMYFPRALRSHLIIRRSFSFVNKLAWKSICLVPDSIFIQPGFSHGFPTGESLDKDILKRTNSPQKGFIFFIIFI